MHPIRTFIVSTRNAHKVHELAEIFGPACRVIGLEDFPGSPKIVEDAPTFEGNARKKAVGLAEWLAGWISNGNCLPANGDVDVLADDSGLEVDALGGAPGVFSARFAAEENSSDGNSPDVANNQKLLRLLRDVPDRERTARFRCVLALAPLVRDSQVVPGSTMSDSVRFFEGACPGFMLRELKGQGGFGYDPLFVPLGQQLTFAELGDAVKNGLSHRAHAAAALKNWLTSGGRQSPT